MFRTDKYRGDPVKRGMHIKQLTPHTCLTVSQLSQVSHYTHYARMQLNDRERIHISNTFPAGHGKQSTKPLAFAYLPISHAVHVREPDLDAC